MMRMRWRRRWPAASSGTCFDRPCLHPGAAARADGADGGVEVKPGRGVFITVPFFDATVSRHLRARVWEKLLETALRMAPDPCRDDGEGKDRDQ